MVTLYQKQKGGLIGIDIGSTSIKLLEVSRNGNDCRIEKFAVVPLSEGVVLDKNIEKPDEVAAIIKRSLSSHKFSSKNVAFSVPMSTVSMSKAKFESSRSDIHIAEEILSSLSKYTQLPLNEVRVDYQIHPSYDGKKEVDIVAVKNEALDLREDIFKTVNLTPVISTIETAAIENALKFIKFDGEKDGIALFDVGHLSTTMYILHRGKISSSRELPVGGGDLTSSIQSFYGVSAEDAEFYKLNGYDDENFIPVIINPFMETISNQISQALNLYENNSGDSINSILLSGGSSNLDGLISYLRQQLERPVNVADVFNGVQINPSLDTHALRASAGSLLLVFGIALSQVGSVINLMPWREEIKKVKEVNYIKGAVVGGLVGALIALAGYSYYKQVETQEFNANELIIATTAKYQTKIDEMKDVSNLRTVMIDRMKLIQGLQTQRPVLVSVLNATVSSLPNEMYLTGVSREGNSFTFQGKARDAIVVAEFLRNLKASGWYDFTFMNSFVAYSPSAEKETGKSNTAKEALYGSFVVTADVPREISSEAADIARKAAEAAKSASLAPLVNGAPDAASLSEPTPVDPSSEIPPLNGDNPSSEGQQVNSSQSQVSGGYAGQTTRPGSSNANATPPQPAPDALPMNRSNSADSSQKLIYSGGDNGI